MADTNKHPHGEDVERRDVLFLATGLVGAVGVAATVWPLVDQMNPAANVLALSTIDVDISGVEVGQEIKVTFLGAPVVIRRLSEDEMAAAAEVPLGDLPDKSDRAPWDGQANVANRVVPGTDNLLVMNAVCTHLGCIPVGNNAGDFGGWFCPCHGSHYDQVGRIRKGPAPENLPIPAVELLDESTIRLG